jgi:YD repeat-containing protein
MKAYKASYNGVCLGFKYEVGETYEMEDIEMCKRGFHACNRMLNTLFYYEYRINFVLFEVELLGKIIEKGDKVVTDKIKIVRVVPPEEYDGFKVDDRGNIIYMKEADGYEHWYEYNARNKWIYHKTSSGYEEWNEYDERNNKRIYIKNSSGFEWRAK